MNKTIKWIFFGFYALVSLASLLAGLGLAFMEASLVSRLLALGGLINGMLGLLNCFFECLWKGVRVLFRFNYKENALAYEIEGAWIPKSS